MSTTAVTESVAEAAGVRVATAERQPVIGPPTTRWIIEIAVTVLLGVTAALLAFGSNYGLDMVRDQLGAQGISFPEKGSPELTPAEFPGLQRYAGQKVDDGPKAKAYADQFIAKHLEVVAGGKSYAEVSAASRANPTDPTLSQQRTTLFEGETLRGLLLYAWGWSVVGSIAGYAAIAAFVGFLLMLGITVAGFVAGRRRRAPVVVHLA